jgi:hypothetical protein
VHSDMVPKFQCKPVTERRSDEANESMSVGAWGMARAGQPKICSGFDQQLLRADARLLRGWTDPFTCCDNWGRARGGDEVARHMGLSTSPSLGTRTTSSRRIHGDDRVSGGGDSGRGVVGEGEVSYAGERKKISRYPNLIRRRRQLKLTTSVC